MNIKSIITAVLALLASTACSGGAKNQTVNNSGTDSVMTKGKALVVFFSHAGDNYSAFPDANVTKGFSIYGHEVRTNKAKVEKWIISLSEK